MIHDMSHLAVTVWDTRASASCPSELQCPCEKQKPKYQGYVVKKGILKRKKLKKVL